MLGWTPWTVGVDVGVVAGAVIGVAVGGAVAAGGERLTGCGGVVGGGDDGGRRCEWMTSSLWRVAARSARHANRRLGAEAAASAAATVTIGRSTRVGSRSVSIDFPWTAAFRFRRLAIGAAEATGVNPAELAGGRSDLVPLLPTLVRLFEHLHDFALLEPHLHGVALPAEAAADPRGDVRLVDLGERVVEQMQVRDRRPN